MSQCECILEHLKHYGSITPLEAFTLYGTLAAHSRVAELRQRGHNIICEMVSVGNGKKVGKYRLVEASNEAQA